MGQSGCDEDLMVLSGSVRVVLYCVDSERPVTLLGRCCTSAPKRPMPRMEDRIRRLCSELLTTKVTRSTGGHSSNFGTRCTSTSSACASVSALIHCSWNGGPETTSHRPITKTRRNGERSQPDRRSYLSDRTQKATIEGLWFLATGC